MQGMHCMADLLGCNPEKLLQQDALMAHCIDVVTQAGLTIVAQQLHVFGPHPSALQQDGGMTLTLLLAQSHVCVHTWPEQGGATLDVYVCNFLHDSGDAALHVLHAIMQWFEPKQHSFHQITRGVIG